jgi:hypothetical protein
MRLPFGMIRSSTTIGSMSVPALTSSFVLSGMAFLAFAGVCRLRLRVTLALLFGMIFTGSDRAAGASSPVEWINMDDQDRKLIRQIVASDGRKYTAGNIDRSRYDRLVDMGWLTPFRTNISDVEYQVTEKGRTASVANND